MEFDFTTLNTGGGVHPFVAEQGVTDPRIISFSVAEMRLLYTMRKIINPVIEQCGGEPLPLDENDCWYWTSTEVEKQQTAKAWLYSMGSGAMQETPKVQAHKVRPIITINE